MTNEFKDRLMEAINVSVGEAIKKEKEYAKKVENNKVYADLYMQLVLSCFTCYDFYNEEFSSDLRSLDIIKKFGNPKRVTALINKKKAEGEIALDYSDDTDWKKRAGEPDFKKNDDFDLKLVNEFLAENGIQVREDSVDSGGYGSHNDYVTFDATMLIEMREKIARAFPKRYSQKK